MRILSLYIPVMMLVLPAAFAIDGQVLINQSTLNAAGGTYTITQPGSYKLSGNLQAKDANTNVIVIGASNVTLDLNGFAILGPTDCSAGFPCLNPGSAIGIRTPQGSIQTFFNITIRNGTIQGTGGGGILINGNSILVEYMHIQSTQGFGAINLNAAGAFRLQNQKVQHSSLQHNGGGILITGGSVSDNIVCATQSTAIGLSAGTVFDNTVMASGAGLNLGDRAGYHGNTMSGNTFSVLGAGTNLGQNLCDGVVCP